MGNSLDYAFSDLYPNWGGVETSNVATIEVDDTDALGEDTEVAEEASAKESSKKSIFLALLIIVLMVVFLGVGK